MEGFLKVIGGFYYQCYAIFDFSAWANIFVGGDVTTPTGKIANNLGELANSIAVVMEPIALAIAVLFFIISLIEFAMSDRLTIESFVKFFAKLAIAIACICMCSELTTGIQDFGNALSTFVADKANFGAALADGKSINTSVYNQEFWENAYCNWFQTTYPNAGVFSAIAQVLNIFLAYVLFTLGGIIITAVLIVISFSRFLELALRAAFMPIAIALIADDGWKGAAGRYIRKFIAICAQGALLTVLMKIFSNGILVCFGWEITATGVNFSDINLFSSAIYVIGFGVAVISVMFKSIGIVNDVFGA